MNHENGLARQRLGPWITVVIRLDVAKPDLDRVSKAVGENFLVPEPRPENVDERHVLDRLDAEAFNRGRIGREEAGVSCHGMELTVLPPWSRALAADEVERLAKHRGVAMH